MAELLLQTTDGRHKELGRVRLDGDHVTFEGVAEDIFRLVQRRRHRSGKSDAEVFELLAKGWSNGPLQLVASRPTTAARAASHHDDEQLHHYWTRGEGLAKWADSPKPWTTLVAHLTKHVGAERAKVYASRWFIEVFGYAAGSDKNRVAHGHPPRGKRVGPG